MKNPGTAGDGVLIDRSRNVVRIRRAFNAPIHRAWWAWTDPAAIIRWWGPKGWVATVFEMDVRPGGVWRFQITPQDALTEPVRGIATYSSVVPLAELAYEDAFADEAWRPDGTGVFPTVVAFASSGGGCVIDVEANYPDGRALQRAIALQMAEGYAEALDRLAAYLDTQ